MTELCLIRSTLKKSKVSYYSFDNNNATTMDMDTQVDGAFIVLKWSEYAWYTNLILSAKIPTAHLLCYESAG